MNFIYLKTKNFISNIRNQLKDCFLFAHFNVLKKNIEKGCYTNFSYVFFALTLLSAYTQNQNAPYETYVINASLCSKIIFFIVCYGLIQKIDFFKYYFVFNAKAYLTVGAFALVTILTAKPVAGVLNIPFNSDIAIASVSALWLIIVDIYSYYLLKKVNN